MDQRDFLFFLTLTGPLFSISNLIGLERTRTLEMWLLKHAYSIFRAALAIALIAFLLCTLILIEILLIAFPFVLTTIGPFGVVINLLIWVASTIYAQYKLRWEKMQKWTGWMSAFFLPGTIILLWANANPTNLTTAKQVAIFVGFILVIPIVPYYFLSFHARVQCFTQQIHAMLRRACKKWRDALNTKPPWPLSTAENSYDFPKAFWLSNSVPFVFIWLGFIVLPSILIMCVVLSPCVFAEKLRRRLTPEKPIFMDLLGYLISVLSVIYLAYERVVPV